MSIDVQLNHYMTLWQRIKTAALFVLGDYSTSGPAHWDSIELEPEQVDQLYILCHQSRAARFNQEAKNNPPT